MGGSTKEAFWKSANVTISHPTLQHFSMYSLQHQMTLTAAPNCASVPASKDFTAQLVLGVRPIRYWYSLLQESVSFETEVNMIPPHPSSKRGAAFTLFHVTLSSTEQSSALAATTATMEGQLTRSQHLPVSFQLPPFPAPVHRAPLAVHRSTASMPPPAHGGPLCMAGCSAMYRMGQLLCALWVSKQ